MALVIGIGKKKTSESKTSEAGEAGDDVKQAVAVPVLGGHTRFMCQIFEKTSAGNIHVNCVGAGDFKGSIGLVVMPGRTEHVVWIIAPVKQYMGKIKADDPDIILSVLEKWLAENAGKIAEIVGSGKKTHATTITQASTTPRKEIQPQPPPTEKTSS